MHAILPTQPAPALTAPRLAAWLLNQVGQSLPSAWPVGALPVPEVSESTWADWMAEEARFLSS